MYQLLINTWIIYMCLSTYVMLSVSSAHAPTTLVVLMSKAWLVPVSRWTRGVTPPALRMVTLLSASLAAHSPIAPTTFTCTCVCVCMCVQIHVTHSLYFKNLSFVYLFWLIWKQRHKLINSLQGLESRRISSNSTQEIDNIYSNCSGTSTVGLHVQKWTMPKNAHIYTPGLEKCAHGVKNCAYFVTFSGLLLHFQTAPVTAQSSSLSSVFLSRAARGTNPSCSLTSERVASSSAHYNNNYMDHFFWGTITPQLQVLFMQILSEKWKIFQFVFWNLFTVHLL